MALVCTWMGDRSGMSISADSPSDETLNQGPLALLLRQQYEFPFGINPIDLQQVHISEVVVELILAKGLEN